MKPRLMVKASKGPLSQIKVGRIALSTSQVDAGPLGVLKLQAKAC